MIEYEKMNKSHVAEIAKLETVCFQDPWSEKSIMCELINPLSLWFVALDRGKVVGYVGSQAVLGEADMMNIAVAPSHRRLGIAQELIETLVKALKGEDVYSLTLEVRVSNDPAKALYEKIGFRQIGLRPNYYRNPKEDALILRKEWVL